MFLASAAFSVLPLMIVRTGQSWPWPMIFLGMIASFYFYVAVVSYFEVIRYGQHSVLWAVISMAISIPLVASIFIWAEKPSIWQWLGLIGVLVTFGLFGLDQRLSERDQTREIPASLRLTWLMLVLLAFVGSGVTQLCAKGLVVQGLGDYRVEFATVLYAGEAIFHCFSRAPGKGDPERET